MSNIQRLFSALEFRIEVEKSHRLFCILNLDKKAEEVNLKF